MTLCTKRKIISNYLYRILVTPEMVLHLSVSKLLRFRVIPLKPLHNTAVELRVYCYCVGI